MKNEKLEKSLQAVMEQKLVPNPGELKVIVAYKMTKESSNAEDLVVDSIIWENEYEEFIKGLNEYEVNSLILNDRSTGLMSTLELLIENGYKVEGLKSYISYSSFKNKELKGLLLKK